MSCNQPPISSQDLEQDGLRLLGKRPNVSYFIVFGSKCFILNKKPKSSKFAPKIDEGFLLGYASNAHGYRVFNNSSGCVEVACDVTFDESNGSQKKQVDLDDAGGELPPHQAIKKMAIGEIKPQENEDQESSEDGPNTAVVEVFEDSGEIYRKSIESGDSGNSDEQVPDQEVVEKEDDPIQDQDKNPHPRVHQSIHRDHLVDNILESIKWGVTTRSRLANFCEHYSFDSSLEPLKVEEALGDPD